MKIVYGCIIFTCFVTYVLCAIISEAKEDEVLSLEEPIEDCVIDGDEDGPENTLLDVDETLPNGAKRSAKKKRCPRVASSRFSDVVGASNPTQTERRDIHSKLNDRLCTSCQKSCNKKHCKTCDKWCRSPKSLETPDEAGHIVESPIPNLQIPPVTLTAPLDSSIVNMPPLVKNPQPQNEAFSNGKADIFTMASRSNIDGSAEKKTFNIDQPVIQPMRGIILRLLGMSNIGDADDMGVWVTTLSNNPPTFEPKNNAAKIFSLCKEAGSELQEEAKEGAKEMVAFMWLQLQKEFQKRMSHLKKPQMSKNDMENLLLDIFKTMNLDSVVSSTHQDVQNFGAMKPPYEILPRYPVEMPPETFIMPQEMNPDIIEGPPANVDQNVGAINERILNESGQYQISPGEDRPSPQETPFNSRMNGQLDSFQHSNEPTTVPEGESNSIPLSPPLEKIGSSALNFIKDVSQDLAKQGHNLYVNTKDDIVKSNPERNYPESSISSDNIPQYYSLEQPEKPNLVSATVDLAARNGMLENNGKQSIGNPDKNLNEAFWNQRVNNVQPEQVTERQNIPFNQNGQISKIKLQGEEKIERPVNRYKGKIVYPSSGNIETNRFSPRPRISEDTAIIAAQNPSIMSNTQNLHGIPSFHRESQPPDGDLPQSIPVTEDLQSNTLVTTKSRNGLVSDTTDPQNSPINFPEQPIVGSNQALPNKGEQYEESMVANNAVEPNIQDQPTAETSSSDIQVGDAPTESQVNEVHESRSHKLKEKVRKIKEKLQNNQRGPVFYRTNEETVGVTPVSTSQSEIEKNDKEVENLGKVDKTYLDVPITKSDPEEVDYKEKAKFIKNAQRNNFKDNQDPLIKSTLEDVVGNQNKDISVIKSKRPKYDSVKAALEKLRAVTKNLEKEIITQPASLIDDDDGEDDNTIPSLGSSPLDSDKETSKIVKELRTVPQVLLEKAEQKLTSAEKTLESLETNTNSKSENGILGSQPLENSLELFSAGARSDKVNPFGNHKAQSADHRILGTPQIHDTNDNMDSNLPPLQDSNTHKVSLRNRMKSAEETPWSQSLGAIVPKDDITIKNSKDIFFVGDGIKLPLNMVKKDDGALHLAVDLEKLCGCKNDTCPHNKTAIEETVGSILEKEAELKDQLEYASNAQDTKGENSVDVLGEGTPLIDSEVGKNNGILGMKNSIASGFDTSELQHENPEILKRSAIDPKGQVEIISVIQPNSAEKSKIIKLEGKDFNAGKGKDSVNAVTNSPPTTTWQSIFSATPLKDFWNKGIDDLKSRLSSMEMFSPFSRGFPNSGNVVVEKEIGKSNTEKPVLPEIVPKSVAVPQLNFGVKPLNIINPLSISQQVLGSFIPLEKISANTKEPTSTPSVIFHPVKPTEAPDLGSKLKSFFSDKFDNKDEKFDIVTKVRGPYEFKGLEHNMKSLEETVEKNKKNTEEVLKDGSHFLQRANEKAAEEEVGLVNDFMNWLTGVSLRN